MFKSEWTNSHQYCMRNRKKYIYHLCEEDTYSLIFIIRKQCINTYNAKYSRITLPKPKKYTTSTIKL